MATLRVTNLRGRTSNIAPDLPDGANITGVATVSSKFELGSSGIGATIHGNGNAVFAGVTTSASFVGPITGDVTGNITGTAATFTGDVSIAGTLTYEDVTNIDATGLITAKSGIKIGQPTAVGATFNPAGDLVVAGIITAGSFDGVVSGIALKVAGSDVSSGAAATMINWGSGVTFTDVNTGFTTATVVATITTSYAYAQSGVITLNLGSAQAHEITLAAGISTFTVTGGTVGDSHSLIVTQPSSGITTVGFSTYFLWPSGSPPNLSQSSASSEIDMVTFVVKQETQTGTGVTQLLASAGLDYQ